MQDSEGKTASKSARKEEQQALEQKWREILLADPTEENYARAYAELHEFKLATRDPELAREKPGLYRGEVSFAGKAIARIVGSGKDVLEIGCGDGALAFFLAEKANRVVAVDVSDVALAFCKEECRSRESAVAFERGEATSVKRPDSSFDVVISQDLVEHLTGEVMSAHLAEVYRLLRPGGSYIFWTPHRLYGETSMGMHLKEYDLKGAVHAVEAAGLKAVWIDGRWYKLGIIARAPSFVRPLAYVWESLLGRIGLGALPMAARQLLAPPIMVKAVKPR
jgi:2-polyprenyl-3-methyl-5-hydroxy-6-metoxy-1,4-benzoquinol methylase